MARRRQQGRPEADEIARLVAAGADVLDAMRQVASSRSPTR
jgi:hypothetical protein